MRRHPPRDRASAALRLGRWLRRLAALLGGALTAAACVGPTLQVEPPQPDRVFVDGHLEIRPELPFRYYGTTVLDVLPADDARGRANFAARPTRTAVAIPPPAPPAWFPLDFPLEVWQWLRHGRTQQAVAVAAAPVPEAERVLRGVRPTGIEQVNARAFAARTSR